MQKELIPEDTRFVEDLQKLGPGALNAIDRLVDLLAILEGIPDGTPGKEEPQTFRDALGAEAAAGTLTTAKLRGYVAAMESALAYPGTSFNPAECALGEIRQDFRTLDTLLSRLLNDDLPEYRDCMEKMSSSLVMNLDAVTDVYNILSEQIEDKIDEALKEVMN